MTPLHGGFAISRHGAGGVFNDCERFAASPTRTIVAAQLLVGVLQPDLGSFWAIRDPLSRFYLGYFVLGWLIARSDSWPALCPLARQRLAGALCVLGLAAWGWALTHYPAWGVVNAANLYSPKVLARILYTLGIVAAIAAFDRVPVASRWVMFLSETTLALYLYHRFFQIALDPHVADWHPLLRIAAASTVGLGGATGVALAGRVILGRRGARLLLGA